MDTSKTLLIEIILNANDKNWLQTLDYEGLIFRCKKCYKVGHIVTKCPNFKSQDKWEASWWKDVSPMHYCVLSSPKSYNSLKINLNTKIEGKFDELSSKSKPNQKLPPLNGSWCSSCDDGGVATSQNPFHKDTSAPSFKQCTKSMATVEGVQTTVVKCSLSLAPSHALNNSSNGDGEKYWKTIRKKKQNNSQNNDVCKGM